MQKITGKVPVGSVILTKRKEELDTGMSIINTDYHYAKASGVVDLEDKRAATKILTEQVFTFMKKNNQYPPGAKYKKSYKNNNVDVSFDISEYDKFTLRFTPELVGDDPEMFLMNLGTAAKRKFIPKDNWKIEAAKSSRAKCQTCGNNIEKDALRVGEPTYYMDHLNYRWHHFECISDDIWGIPKENLLGFEGLSSEQKDKVKKTLW